MRFTGPSEVRGGNRLVERRTTTAKVGAGVFFMLKLEEYLESAQQFERLAADETDPAIKAQFEKQAEAYRKLAERRAEFLRGARGVEAPPKQQ
jgi:hypothetical protein